MGYFSWIDVDGQQNITEDDKIVALLIPKEHKDTVAKIFGIEDCMGKNGIEGTYSGFGDVNTTSGKKIDFYDVTPFLNICCTSDKEYADMIYYKTTNEDLHTRLSSADVKICDRIRQAYKNGEINSIDDIKNIDVKDLDSDFEFRSIGIDLACYDEDNARMPYPIKVTLDPKRTYENSNFSMGDPKQGFYKVGLKEKSHYEYYEGDWGYGEPTVEEEEWNEETGEYETIEVDNPDYVDPWEDYCESDDYSKYQACEELEELDEKRFEILEEVRAEKEAKGLEVAPEAPKVEPPRPDYTLVGVDGNAFSVMGYTSRALKNEGLGHLVDEMREKAMASDYSNLLCVCDEYIDMANDAKNGKSIENDNDEQDLDKE